jgi:hypothetical protein
MMPFPHESLPRFAKSSKHEKALTRPVPSTRCDLPLALGRMKIRRMRCCVCVRACVSACVPRMGFLRSRTRVGEGRVESTLHVFAFLHVLTCSWRVDGKIRCSEILSRGKKSLARRHARRTRTHVFEGSGGTCVKVTGTLFQGAHRTWW